jgi:hypothetical protein
MQGVQFLINDQWHIDQEIRHVSLQENFVQISGAGAAIW